VWPSGQWHHVVVWYLGTSYSEELVVSIFTIVAPTRKIKNKYWPPSVRLCGVNPHRNGMLWNYGNYLLNYKASHVRRLSPWYSTFRTTATWRAECVYLTSCSAYLLAPQKEPPVSAGSSILGVELPKANTIELRSFFRFESIRASRS
jgi:hypothetical protein